METAVWSKLLLLSQARTIVKVHCDIYIVAIELKDKINVCEILFREVFQKKFVHMGFAVQEVHTLVAWLYQ